MKENTYKNPMGYEPLLKLIPSMSIPVMLSMLVQALYNLTDSFFVARYSEQALRATSLSFPIQIIIVAFGVGTGLGINSYISRSLGANEEENANQGAMHGIILAVLSWLVFIVFTFTGMKGFFNHFTTDPVVRQMGYDYLTYVSGFSIFSLMQITIEKTIQGTGDTVTPMKIQLIGAITNIILDPIMIFGMFGFPEMGIKGAAIATLIGQALATIYGLCRLFSGKTLLNVNFKRFVFDIKIVRKIYEVGLPSILMQSLNAFVTTILNLIVIQYSEVAVSVLGIFFKLESFLLMPIYGLGQGVLPIIGYNFGAKNKERVVKTYDYALYIGWGIILVGVILFQFFPRQLIGIFTDNEEMMAIGVYTLRIISSGYLFATFTIITITFLQALGMGKLTLGLTILRQLVLVLPFAYIFSKIGLNYIWLAYPISEVVTLIFAVIAKRKVIKDKVENI